MASKIRRELNEDEWIDTELGVIEELFLFKCHGVALVKRSENDLHISFYLLTEDDGHWFVSTNPSSSYWLPEVIELLTHVNKWLEENALPDIPNKGYMKNTQCGFKFKY